MKRIACSTLFALAALVTLLPGRSFATAFGTLSHFDVVNDTTATGFEPDCPDMTVPGAATSCVAPFGDLEALIARVDCVTAFAVDCSADLAVPSLLPYPTECP